MEKLLKLLETKAEELNWSYAIDPNLGEVELAKHSPAGEDFNMVIKFDRDNPVETFLSDLREYASDFDVDEHVELWIPNRGKRGCPSSISELVRDAEAIKDMIGDLSAELDGSAKKVSVRIAYRKILEISQEFKITPEELILLEHGNFIVSEAMETAMRDKKEAVHEVVDYAVLDEDDNYIVPWA